MLNLGLKLWSSDFFERTDFIKSAIENVHKGYFNYIELFAVPDTFNDTKEKIKSQLNNIPVIIHAPHLKQGIDIGNMDIFDENIKKHKDSLQFADLLDGKYIIVHSHISGTTENAIKHIKELNDKRIVVESLPYFEQGNTNILNLGAKPEDIKEIMEATNCGFCFDFSHITCAANALGEDPYKFYEEFFKLKPNMYHICDGKMDSTLDAHLHFGQGNYPLKELIEKYVVPGSPITMETGRGLPTNTNLWVEDSIYLNNLLGIKKHSA